MKRMMTLALVSVFAWTATAMAGPGCGKSQKTAEGEKGKCPYATAACDAAAKAALTRVTESLPKMTYTVGDFSTCCEKTAAAKSEETKTPVTYVVAGTAYESEPAANAKLAELLEAEIAKLTTVQYDVAGESYACPREAANVAQSKNTQVHYLLAGFEFDSKDKADAAAKAVADAVAKLAQSGTEATGTPKAGTTCSPGCGADKAKTASANESKSGCGGAKAETASAKDSKSGGCTGKGQTAAAKDGKAGCCAGKAQTASTSSCQGTGKSCDEKTCAQGCPKARVAAAQKKVEVIVGAAATVYTS
jgi:hypothetical protein